MRLKHPGKGFRADERGSVALIFALSLFVVVGLIGAAVDYSRAATVRSKLDNAADAAALAAVAASMRNQLKMPDNAAIKSYFLSAAGNPADTVITTVTVTTVPSITSVIMKVAYQATVKSTFLNVLGIAHIPVSGSATSGSNKPKYVNFYLMLDNSPSMGLGATAGDIAKLQALTPDSCAFACHQHTFDNQKRITGDSKTDYYTIAKNNGVTTRIDVLRDATANLTSTASKSEQMPSQFSMAVYTFSDVVNTISALNNNLVTGSDSVQTLTKNIDLAYAYQDQRDTQTSFDTALTHLNNFMPNPGDGSTASSPQQFLFVVTDGVQDQPVKGKSGSGNKADIIAPNSAYIPPAVVTSPNLDSSKKGNVSGTRLISTLDDSQCQAIKARGIRIAVLYTPYLPVTSNSFYNSWVAPIAPSIPTKLQSCASEGFFFQITPTQGINEAMQAMFQAAIAVTRLTQ